MDREYHSIASEIWIDQAIKFQSYTKSGRIDAFEQKISVCLSFGDYWRGEAVHFLVLMKRSVTGRKKWVTGSLSVWGGGGGGGEVEGPGGGGLNGVIHLFFFFFFLRDFIFKKTLFEKPQHLKQEQYIYCMST